MMTRKDYERISQVFRVNKPYWFTRENNETHAAQMRIWNCMLDDTCVQLNTTNSRFDHVRFVEACHP
jgi:hypothetical protein